MSTFLKLINKDGGVIYSNIPKVLDNHYDKCVVQNEQIEKNGISKKMRHGKILTDLGTVYMITDEKEIVDRPRYFKEKLMVYADFLNEIQTIKDELTKEIQADNRRLVHNITSSNARNIQELYLVVPADELSKDYKTVLDLIKSYIKKDIESAALAFLRIAKNSIAMKAEFTVFKKLYGRTPILQKQTHDIRQVLLLVFHVFFQDFKDLNVHVQVDDCRKKLLIDFETIRVALYHLIDNISKYILPHTLLRVRFVQEPRIFKIVFDMISMEIKKTELQDIFKDGVSGENAKKANRSGDGLGMSIICKILMHNSAELKIFPNATPLYSKRENEINYVRNIFEINFNI